MERLMNPAQVAAMIGCKPETARKLMREMPLVNLSPIGCSRPRYAVKESDFKSWMQRRTMTTSTKVVRPRAATEYKLEYRR